MRVGILVLPGAALTSVMGPIEILTLADSLARRGGIDKPIDTLSLSLVAEHSGRHPAMPAVKLETIALDATASFDWVVISAAGPIPPAGPRFSADVLAWVNKQYEKGASLGSICTGAFLLAETGLLSEKVATTHWRYESLFRRRYPTVHLQAEKLVTHSGRFLCSGGANAYLDFALHWVELIYGARVAGECAKWLVLDRYRGSQTRYARFFPPRRHGDAKVLQVQNWLDSYFAQPIQIEELALQVHLSERQFKRRFKAATGDSPLEYLQKIRIEQARDRLEYSGESIEQIAQAVGYEDVGFFRSLFRRQTSQTPAQYRRHAQAR